jgi:hypothetical protein
VFIEHVIVTYILLKHEILTNFLKSNSTNGKVFMTRKKVTRSVIYFITLLLVEASLKHFAKDQSRFNIYIYI